MVKILLVDDEEILVQMYQKKFEEEGYEVKTAFDGEAAISMLKEYTPNLILLDIALPKLDGISVLNKIKEDPQTKAIPVVVLTNQASSEAEKQSAFEAGAVSYLVKASFVPKEIVQKVREILSGYVNEEQKMF